MGTSTTGSKVWCTLAGGTLSEIYHPSADTPDSRSPELVVTDGKSFAQRGTANTTRTAEPVDQRSPTHPCRSASTTRPCPGVPRGTAGSARHPRHRGHRARLRARARRRHRRPPGVDPPQRRTRRGRRPGAPRPQQAHWDNGFPRTKEFRFGVGVGVGVGEQSFDLPSRDTDTRDPDTIDVITGDADRSAVLDWTATSPVVLPFVDLRAP